MAEKHDDMRNLLFTISYDGRNYHGWQIQKNAVSVQEVFQNSLKKIIGEYCDIKGCSRTDTGVHANMYCISVKISKEIPCERMVMAMNRYLPSDVAVIDCKEVPMDFHARYSCLGKEYVYKIWNNKVRKPFLNGYALHYWYPLDVDELNEAAKSYIGKHDFTSFCTLDNRAIGDMARTVKVSEVTRKGSVVEFRVSADGFLYNMVRIMVGTLLRVAQGKILKDEIESIINAKDRSKSGPTAPACGLYLDKVFYKM